jgi:hypothetical protein
MVGLKYTETEKETTTTPRATTRPRTLAALLPRRLLPNGPRKLVALLVVSLLAALPLALARTPSGCFCTSCSNSATVSSTRTLFAADIDTDKMDRVTIEYDLSVNDGDDPSSIAVFVSHENSGSTSYSGPGLMTTTQCVDDSVTFSAASHKSSTAYVVVRCLNSFASCPVVYNIKMSYTPKSSSSSGGTTTTTTGGGTTSTSTTTTTTSSTTASSSSLGGVLIYIGGCRAAARHRHHRRLLLLAQAQEKQKGAGVCAKGQRFCRRRDDGSKLCRDRRGQDPRARGRGRRCQKCVSRCRCRYRRWRCRWCFRPPRAFSPPVTAAAAAPQPGTVRRRERPCRLLGRLRP